MAENSAVWPLVVAGRDEAEPAIEVRSPWDGTPVGAVPEVGEAEVRAAIDAAWDAMRQGLPAHERASVLDRAAAEVRAERARFAELLAREAGKPLKFALVEVDRCIQTLTFSAVAARTLAGRGVPVDAHPSGTGRRAFTIRVPIGVVGAITPFNFPLNLAAHKVGPAIAAGCGVVLKPAPKAPLSAIELVRTLHRAGLPPEWLSVVLADPEEVAGIFADDDRVRLITFTGSSDVGWRLAARAARKRVTLELGNSTPMIVCADADLEAAARAAAASAFGFAGQSCISVQRLIVHAPVYKDFLALLDQATANLVCGDPLDSRTDVGPVITREARDRIVAWVNEAVDAGARQVRGGIGANGHLQPVILDDVPPSARVWQHEVFGPVVSVRPFQTLDEAIDLANGTAYGLQAGIFTRDLATAFEAIERLEFGGVTVNEAPTFRVDQMPYGGTKASGNTREGPASAVEEMTEERTVVVALG